MSKSKSNFCNGHDLFAKGVTPAALRLELIRTHYRSNSNFTMQGLEDGQRMVGRWTRMQAQLIGSAKQSGALDELRAPGPLERALAQSTEAYGDDLNVSRATAALNEAVGATPVAHSAACPHLDIASVLFMDSVLGVLGRDSLVTGAALAQSAEFISAIESFVAQRAAKGWPESDLVRAELTKLGVAVKDEPQGATWSMA